MLPDTLNEFRSVLNDIVFKAGIPAVIGALQWFTQVIPVLMVWIAFVYAVLQLYVFVRDKVRRPKKPESEI